MVSKKTNGSTEARTISERLNQSAYSYYSSTAVVPLSGRSTSTGLKRIFAAALLSSSSIMVLSSPASALGPAACNPVMPANGTTVNCTGVTTSSQDFTGDNLTIIADENFNQDTSGNTIGAQRVNAGIFITGSGGTIQHSGTIKTGEIPEGMGTYGRHNGLYIIGGTGNVSAENTATGSITTTAVDSAGIQVSATTGTSTANNRGTINTSGENSDGIYSSNYATSIATNTGSITVTGDGSRGIVTSGNTTTVNNTGTVSATGTGTYGVHARSFSVATTNVTNSGTITQSGASNARPRYGSAGVFASGPTVNITNTSTGRITGTEASIRLGSSQTATIVNDGTLNGDVTIGNIKRAKFKTVPTLAVTNSGTINGRVAPRSMFASTVTNNGGAIGDGAYAFIGGRYNDTVTISGSGNVINGAISTGTGYAAADNVVNFNQTDTLTLTNGTQMGNFAIAQFGTVNFNSGTTRFGNETAINLYSLSTPTQVNVNAGATLSTSSTNFAVNTRQLNVAGRGTSRGTLQAPAGSTIRVTGDTTFNAGGRFRVGVASDTSAGYLNGGDGTVTFNAGSEIYADVTRGVELTDGGAIKIAGVDSGEGGMIVDNNVGGTKVYDNTVLFSFTSEVRTNSELFLITKRELRARTATENQGGRTNAEVIADAIDEFIDNAPSDNPIVTFLAQFPVEEQEAQLAKLVEDTLPSESGASGSSTVVSTDMVLDLIMDRLSGGGFTVVDSGERQTGVAAGEQFLGGAGNWALWGRAGASFAEFDPSGVNGFESDTYAVSLGMDGDVAEHLRMGLAVFYSDTKVDEIGTGANSNQDIEGYGVLLYGTYRPADFYVNATLGYGMNEYDSRRSAAGGINTANYDGTQFMARAEVGKVFTEGAWDVSPHVGLRFNKVDIDGYTETGILPTTVASQSLTSLRGVLGVSGRYTHVLEDGAKLIPEAYVRGLQELADPNEAITGTVVGGGSFISQTQERDKFSYAAGAGVTYEMDEQFSVRFLYDGEFQTDYQEHSITAAVRYQF